MRLFSITVPTVEFSACNWAALGFDLDGFGDLADGQGEIEPDGLLHLTSTSLIFGGLEAGSLDSHVVGAGRQGRKTVVAGGRADGLPYGVGVDVAGFHAGRRNGGAGGVRDTAGDFAEGLGVDGQGQRTKQKGRAKLKDVFHAHPRES